MKRKIFLSYASPHDEAAARIELALKGEGHSVFRDRSALPPGESFDARIRAAIDESDLFIFLISRESVSAGRYTLTELKFAEEKWQHPAGHVLPVWLEPLPKEDIPAFLRAVTILKPAGDVAAEVSAAVDRMARPWRRWLSRPAGLAAAVLVALLGVGAAWRGFSFYWEQSARKQAVAALLEQSQMQAEAGNYAGAWALLEKAAASHPDSAELTDLQERLAMEWLQNARGSQLTGTLREIAERVSPVLWRGAAKGKGERAADLTAHVGWADFLRSREGVAGLDPAKHYRRALAIDPRNVFAHAMSGFEILRQRGPAVDAKRHFAAALESNRKREYVRRLQFAGLLWARDPELECEAIRVADEMRRGGEAMAVADSSEPQRLWSIYYSRLVSDRDKAQFLAALPPADHLATFRWLYPEDRLAKEKYPQYLYVLAQLQELNGERAHALASYRKLQSQVAGHPGPLLDGARAAIARLSK
ncbi:MAG TPA: toll/interleukin-1 receptor domain-containing protein [Candidatus Acidoferrales bacterium]|nr:toll/interleukin-1 receptor domain-containing protein [Candidatus Acidoferrales bacterium]